MRTWTGSGWVPAKSWNGIWWNNLAYDQCYVSSFTGAPGRVNSVPVGRSFTLISQVTASAGVYGRVGEAIVGRTRLRCEGTLSQVTVQFTRAQNGVDVASPITLSWNRVAGQAWVSATYDGHNLTATYAGETKTSHAPIAGFDNFAPSGEIPLLCETTGAIAVLVPGKLTQTQTGQVIADFESSRTTKTPPALLAPVAPVANLGPGESVTLPLPETSPRSMFYTASTDGAGSTIRNANGAIVDNRLGLINYNTFSRAVYVDRTGTQQYLDNPGRSWAMSAWWDGANAGLYSQRDSLTKQAEASLTPMPWTVVNGSTGLRLLAYDQRLPDDRIASITHWLAWVER